MECSFYLFLIFECCHLATLIDRKICPLKVLKVTLIKVEIAKGLKIDRGRQILKSVFVVELLIPHALPPPRCMLDGAAQL